MMTVLSLYRVICFILAFSAINAYAMNAGIDWKLYSDPGGTFSIQYPIETHVETASLKKPLLLSQVAFRFEQPFRRGEDVGSFKFSFTVSVWSNPESLPLEAWAGRGTGLRGKILDSQPIQLVGREGLRLHTSTMAWTTVHNFVADKTLMYDLSYTDMSSNILLDHDTQSHWSAVMNVMLKSFKPSTFVEAK